MAKRLAASALLLLACGHPPGPPPAAPPPAAAAIEVRPGSTLGAALARARPGDRVLVHAGAYPREELEASFAATVTIEPAPGASVELAGLTFTRSRNVTLRGLRFTGTLTLAGSSHFSLEKLDLDAGDGQGAALHLLGKKPFGPTHHVRVTGSRIAGGGRTVFILTHFTPSVEWNHQLEFVGNTMSCGSRNCFQLSGARDTVIADNHLVGSRSNGILLAGATRIQMLRNRLDGGRGAAILIGTPGAEWDRFAGVEHMISSDILVADNSIKGWGTAIQLDGCRDVEIRKNVAEGSGLVTHRREPHGLAGNVILVGNSGVKLRQDQLPDVRVADGDTPPVVEP